MKKALLLTLSILLISNLLPAQKQKTGQSDLLQPPFTPATERMKSVAQRQKLMDNSLVAKVPFRSVGPSVFGGRVADIEVNEDDPTHFFVAYASGGLWKTVNNGISFEPVFDQEAVMTIGDIAVDWQRNTIWIGTGEVNSSRSSYAGVGMYKSTDGGKTWQHKGLAESHHIGRILLHPTDPDILWVAVLGHLYSPNQDRGVFKTTDGGATWRRVLFVDQDAGAVDLVMEPGNSNVLFAASWDRSRRAWDFRESGKNSGIWKSTDGGENWTLVSTPENSFPTGEGVGRIGLAASKENGKTVLFAVLDNQNRRPKKEDEEKKDELVKNDLRNISKEAFLKIEDKKLAKFLKTNGFPEKYTTEKVKKMVEKDEIKPAALVEYLEDAGTLLFDTEVIGAEVYRSDDGGKSWTRTHDEFLDDVFYTYGYYFGQIRASQRDAKKLYIFGVPVLKSADGGKTWKSINGKNVHVDHHALWVDSNRDGHLILGNDGGINISYDDGDNWNKVQHPAVGQFYYINVDMAEPYNIYGGTQDNGVWKGTSTYEPDDAWQMDGNYPFKTILGGDGMQVMIDTRDNTTVYTGYQFGVYFRMDTKNGKTERISPQHELGERPYRYNWQTPIHLSVHNQDILYMGSHKLHRSLDQGKTWEAISDDLTKGGRKGNVPFGTLSAVHESPLKFGLIYAGSDDGLLHVTKNGGDSWTNITPGLPENYWIARVQASQHEKGRVYVALNGYRWDNMNPMVYVSEDFGKTWKKIGKDLPLEPVNVVKEDPKNPNLLYVGTDHGVYISLDRGEHFMALKEGLPAVAVHDVVVHPRENELIIGTHGRSIYVGDVAQVQQLADSILEKEIFVFDMKKVRYNGNWGTNWSKWLDLNEPEFLIPIFSKMPATVTISVFADSILLKSWTEKVERGLNYAEYDLTFDQNQKEVYEKWLNEKRDKKQDEIYLEKGKKNGKWYLRKGKYKVEIKSGSNSVSKEFSIE